MKHNSLPEDNRSRNQTRNQPDSSSTGNEGEKKRKVVVIQRIPRKGSGIGGAIASALLVVLMLYFGYLYMRSASTPEVEVSMSEIVSQIEDENVDELIVRENRLIADLKEEVDDNEIVYAYTQGNTDVFTFLQGEGITLSESGIDVSVEPVTRVNWVDVLSLVFMLLLAGGVFMFVRNMQTSGGKLLDFGQSRARLLFGKRSDVGFDDVAGIK